MKIKHIEADIFEEQDEQLKDNLIRSGVCPVNRIYMPLLTIAEKIILLYGSYGSGKSIFIVDRLLTKAIENKYFRCYYGRKQLTDVRGSIHKTLTDRIKERKLESYFNFSDAPNGSLTIVCKHNGNSFIAFGANDIQSLKSIKDPTDFFCEELNQFEFDDFSMIYSRLRKKGALLQFWGAFNTDKLYKSHWIRAKFFEGEFADKCHKLKSNYYHNYYAPDDYLETLRISSGGNKLILNAISEGEFVLVKTGGEFWKGFNEEKNIKKVPVDPKKTIHISLDNNVNPYITATIWQIDTDTLSIYQVGELLARPPDNSAPKAARLMVNYLRSIGYEDVLFVYGDPSGNARSTIDENNASFFDKYINELQKNGVIVSNRVQKSAPEIALSAAFISEIYESNLYGWSIYINEECFSSIEDYLLVQEDVDGTMKKVKKKDKDTQVTYEPNGHISDTKRYFITTILESQFRSYKSRKNNKMAMVAQ